MTEPITGKKAEEILRRGIEFNGKVIQLVNIDKFHVDHTYQRSLIQSHVDRIRREFNPSLLGIFQACQRKGSQKLHLTDAQHRLVAMKNRRAEDKDEGNKQVVPDEWLTLITKGTSRKKEAQQFIGNNSTKTVTGASHFRARLVAGGEPECTIKELIEKEGFALDFLGVGKPTATNSTSNGIRGVQKLREAYNQFRSELPGAIKLLRLLSSVNGRAKSVPFEVRTGEVIYSLCIFLKRQADKMITGIAQYLRLRHLDLVDMWKKSKRMAGGCGWERFDIMADNLDNFITGYSQTNKKFRLKAA